MHAGSLGPHYDIHTLVEAARVIDHLHLPLKITIAGTGPLEDYVMTASQSHRCLAYVGSLSPSKLSALYQTANIGLACYGRKSNVEMPDKVYDYMNFGLATVYSLTGEIHEFLSEYGAGFHYTAGDTESLVAVLESLCNNPDLLSNAQYGATRLATRFTSDVQYGDYAKFIVELAGRGLA